MNAIVTRSDQPKSFFGRIFNKSHQENSRPRRIARVLLWIVIPATVAMLTLGFIWSREPKVIDVRELAVQTAGADETKLVPGYATTSAVIAIADTLLNKNGGYLSNDITPPSIFLDNMTNWERGVLIELRDIVRALRNDFSRSQTQSGEDQDLVNADAQFHFDADHWILPAAENEYRSGMTALENYQTRLGNGQAEFFIRADNLNFYMATVEKRLGSLSQRLSENVRDPMLRGLLFDDANVVAPTQQSTPWLEIDDVFFEARGYIWAVLHVLKGIEMDFKPILESKNATVPLYRIIEKLESVQQALWSPMILNSSGFGVLTNHSLIIASYISRANAALIDLRLLLAQG